MRLALASVIKVLICPCFNRNPFRSAKNVGSSLEGKYRSVLPQWSACHLGRTIHHLDRDVEVRLKGRSVVQKNVSRKKLPKKVK